MLIEEYRRINNCDKNKVQIYANSSTGVVTLTIGDRTIVAKNNSLESVIDEVRKQRHDRLAQSKIQTARFMEKLNSIGCK
ncbi:hypothetical protein [Bacillus sp. AFS088145]|uniref:hypothetical protein n=1 Tax=Bacillus sp. AFS088145 TaxID=2033514 RepID=UPI000BF8E067|nr:hypothetical protein [Bacillus sp. AFS088145]PFH90590.1 hypothetical protein COI44_03640 [Bacillus sp. AFS088145]